MENKCSCNGGYPKGVIFAFCALFILVWFQQSENCKMQYKIDETRHRISEIRNEMLIRTQKPKEF